MVLCHGLLLRQLALCNRGAISTEGALSCRVADQLLLLLRVLVIEELLCCRGDVLRVSAEVVLHRPAR